MKRLMLYLTLILAFLLGTKDGFIALWRDGEQTPAAVFPYRADSLPVSDREALEKGIFLESEEQLHRLLEDYLS